MTEPNYDDYRRERGSWTRHPVLTEALWIMGTGAFIAACVSAGIIARYWKG